MTVALAGGKRHFYPNEHRDGRIHEDFTKIWEEDETIKFVETRDDLLAYAEGINYIILYNTRISASHSYTVHQAW